MGDESIDRREFTLQSAMAILSVATITISGCSDGDSNPGPGPSPGPGHSTGATGVVSANHGHTATITGAQLTARNAIQLTITGSATHPHTVDLTAAGVGMIADLQRVSKSSSTDDGHLHTVTFN